MLPQRAAGHLRNALSTKPHIVRPTGGVKRILPVYSRTKTARRTCVLRRLTEDESAHEEVRAHQQRGLFLSYSPVPAAAAAAAAFVDDKVLSEIEQKQLAEGRAADTKGIKMDETDYEIRVEAYDPAVLKHHVLHILDEHIKLCLSDHPHLFTLGCVARRRLLIGPVGRRLSPSPLSVPS